jgi:hypothetical protein
VKSFSTVNEVHISGFYSVKALNECLKTLGAGDPDSFVRKVKIGFHRIYDPLRGKDELLIGEAVEWWKLEDCSDPVFTAMFLRSAIGKPLTAFMMSTCTIFEADWRILNDVLRNPHLKDVCFRENYIFGEVSAGRPREIASKVLPFLAPLESLDSLSLELGRRIINIFLPPIPTPKMRGEGIKNLTSVIAKNKKLNRLELWSLRLGESAQCHAM